MLSKKSSYDNRTCARGRRGRVKIMAAMVMSMLAAAALTCPGCVTAGKRDARFEAWKAQYESRKAPNRTVLKFGLFPIGDLYGNLLDRDTLIAYLSDKTGMEIRPVVFRNYDEMIRALAHGAVDFAKINSLGYVSARARGGAQCLLERARSGNRFYYGIIFTRVDSGIENLKELRGRSMIFVDENSTSGYLFPRALLMDNGVDIDRDLSNFSFAGGHTDAVLAVLLGKADAGASISTSFIGLTNPTDAAKMRVLATTDPIPEEPIAVRAGLPEPLKKKIAEAFISIKSPEDREKFLEGRDYHYIPCNEADYDVIRKHADLLGVRLK